MVSMTLAIDDGTRKLMKKYPEINWSGVVRKALEQKVEELESIENMKKSLANEQELSLWAVKLQKQGRAGRFLALKKKGLI